MKLPENRDIAEEPTRLPWHKPLVQRLVVAADTRAGGGSIIDQDGFEFLLEDEVISP